jgi:hypothetical protein
VGGISEEFFTARVPADIDRPDVVVARLTFRQVAIIAGTGAGCWLLFAAVHRAAPHVPVLVLLAPLMLPVLIAAGVALGVRDGISADRYLAAAVRHLRRPRVLVDAPNGVPAMPTVLPKAWRKAAGPRPSPLVLPAAGIDGAGVLDVREHGHAGIAAASTVNFSLRTTGEQNALVAGFGRFLNSLCGPVQILVRTHRVDLSGLVADLEQAAGGLAHPALEAAARDHAAFLTQLSGRQQLLGRQVLLVAREPAAGTAEEAGSRIAHRQQEAAAALAGAQVTVAPYTIEGVLALLADAAAQNDPIPQAGRP